MSDELDDYRVIESHPRKPEPVIVHTPFTERAILIQKATEAISSYTGWPVYEDVIELWLPVPESGVPDYDQIEALVKQHGGDRWVSLEKYR